MGHLFSALLFAAILMITPAHRAASAAQPVFFSMLFPQLIPQEWLLPQEKEAAFL